MTVQVIELMHDADARIKPEVHFQRFSKMAKSPYEPSLKAVSEKVQRCMFLVFTRGLEGHGAK